jgi:hypothetical protein
LLIFDLFGGGAPRRILWHGDTDFALIDIAAEKEIAFAKIEAQKEIDAYKAGLQAQVQASRPQAAQAA